MNFGNLLRLILTINDIKMYNLAETLGYDKSYVSKWVNHTKLPPSKDISQLADQIAAFVLQESGADRKRITSQELGFCEKNGKVPNDEIFAARLSSLIREAYWQSKYAVEKDGSRMALNPSGAVLPFEEEPAGEAAPTTAEKPEAVMECILGTQPVSKSGRYRNVLDDFRGQDMERGRIKLTAMIDLVQFAEHIDYYWKHICQLLSIGSHVDVELMEFGRNVWTELPDQLLIVKNQCVFQSVQSPFSDKSVSIQTEDPAVVQLYCEDARQFLQCQQPILESSVINENLYYYKYASTSKQKRYLLSSMFPIYMTEDFFYELQDKFGGEQQNMSPYRSAYMKEAYLREFPSPKSVVIFDSALLRYMRTGKISTFDAQEGEAFNRKDRKRHLQSILNELEEGDRLELKILNDKNPLLNYEDVKVSFFMNDTSAYCTDIRRKEDGVRYFVSGDCRRHLQTFLDHIHALPEEYLTSGKKAMDYIYNGLKTL